MDGPPNVLIKSVTAVTQQTAVHETGYTIRILFRTIRPRNWTPNFENVAAHLVREGVPEGAS